MPILYTVLDYTRARRRRGTHNTATRETTVLFGFSLSLSNLSFRAQHTNGVQNQFKMFNSIKFWRQSMQTAKCKRRIAKSLRYSVFSLGILVKRQTIGAIPDPFHTNACSTEQHSSTSSTLTSSLQSLNRQNHKISVSNTTKICVLFPISSRQFNLIPHANALARKRTCNTSNAYAAGALLLLLLLQLQSADVETERDVARTGEHNFPEKRVQNRRVGEDLRKKKKRIEPTMQKRVSDFRKYTKSPD